MATRQMASCIAQYWPRQLWLKLRPARGLDPPRGDLHRRSRDIEGWADSPGSELN
jgi:hypothetical protein